MVEVVSVPRRRVVKGRGGGFARLESGRCSKVVKRVSEKWGLLNSEDIKSLPADTVEQLKVKAKLLDEYSKASQALLQVVRSGGGVGFAVMDKLIDLRTKIMQREKKILSEGGDPLEDSKLLKWHSLEFEMMKFLEKLKFDTAKTKKELDLKEQELKLEELDAKSWTAKKEEEDRGVGGDDRIAC